MAAELVVAPEAAQDIDEAYGRYEGRRAGLGVVAARVIPNVGSAIEARRLKLMDSEPWYGVRLVYRLNGRSAPAYEERVLIVRAGSLDEAIAKAERYSKDYEDETTIYTGYAMAFHIVDENGPSLGEGVEVFSLIRDSDLDVDEYLDRFHDSGREHANHTGDIRGSGGLA